MDPRPLEPSADRLERFDPYAAPAPHAVPVGAAVARATRHRTHAKLLLGASMAGFLLSFAVMAANAPRPSVFLFAASAVLALVGTGYGVGAVVAGAGSGGGGGMATAVILTVLNGGMTLLGAFAALLSTMTFTRGRQIRSLGRIVLPPVEASGAWATPGRSLAGVDVELDVDDPALRRSLAEQWRENGRTEHASVAAFARLTLDLVALGAPPRLVADANHDALDEIRHAELCFGLACALDGRAASPGPFPEASRARTLSGIRTVALAQLAVDSLVDGALHEGVSARIVGKLARRCTVPSIQHLLKEIAADEGRHSRHGWDVALWCLAEGGEPVARALEGALRTLPDAMTSPLPDAARDGGWERFGIMGSALEGEEHAAMRASVVHRCREAIAARRAGGHDAVGDRVSAA